MTLIYGVVDLGSNTIRLSIYQCEGRSFRLLLHKKEMAGLAGYIKKGTLTRKGMERACQALIGFRDILANFSIDHVSVFSTAPLRNIRNTEQAVSFISGRTGFAIDVLSGKEEAELDFVGATHALPNKRGLLVDIGGGSTELVLFEDRTIQFSASLPFGSLVFFDSHVHTLFPTQAEQRRMKSTVLEALRPYARWPKLTDTHICGVGGTIRAAHALANDLFDLPKDRAQLDVAHVKKILARAHRAEQRELVRALVPIVPDRIHTILPGMVILSAIAKYFQCQTVDVSRYGVREGYLLHHILKEGIFHVQ